MHTALTEQLSTTAVPRMHCTVVQQLQLEISAYSTLSMVLCGTVSYLKVHAERLYICRQFSVSSLQVVPELFSAAHEQMDTPQ
jgi:hypothetical protein